MTAGTEHEALLSTRALTKDFRGFTAVRQVGLDVAAGSIHALVGPNGAGKTTLFNLLSGFLTPTSGTITFDGRDITGKQPEEIAHLGVARSFQITSLFDNLTALEHLELALASPTGLGLRFWRSSRTLRLELVREVEQHLELGTRPRGDTGQAPALQVSGYARHRAKVQRPSR